VELEALAQSILVEAVRNAIKHADAKRVEVSLAADTDAFTLDIRNQCKPVSEGTSRGGIGLRLAMLEALQHGAVLEYGQCAPGVWQVRLVASTS
jgi:nitrate/nitrite-specific signal transduction histidine kinase